MRPPKTGVVARVVGTIACNDKVHQVNNAVAVTIVLAEVNLWVDGIKSRTCNFATFVSSVVLVVIHRDWSRHIKLGLELAA